MRNTMKDSRNVGIAPHQTGMNTGPKPSALAREAVTPIHPRLLDLEGAAQYLGVSSWTIRDMLDAGKIPRVRLPGEDGKEIRKVLIDRNDLDQLVDQWKDQKF